MVKLAAWLKAMGYFKKVTFIFLIVGHTKNAADSLFNSLKQEYRKKNLFTSERFFHCLGVSEFVTILPTLPGDFLDYNRLFYDVYRNLVGKVKVNHIFFVSGDGPFPVIKLREGNLDEHPISNQPLPKRCKAFNSATELKAH